MTDTDFDPAFSLPVSGRFKIVTPTKKDGLELAFERDNESVRATLIGYGRRMVFVVSRGDR